MYRAIGKMLMPRPRARRIHVVVTARGPAMHHRVGHVGMKLEAEGVAALERLHGKIVALREQLGAMRQLKAFAMPVIDVIGPVRADGIAGRCGADRVIADLGDALRMRRDPGAELLGQHLRAEADAEERPLLAQRNLDPVDLAADIVVGIVGAHRAAEEHGTGMRIQRLRKRIAEARAADVERVAERTQHVADAAGRGSFLVQDDQDRTQGIRLDGARPLPGKGQDVGAHTGRPKRHGPCF